MMFKHGKGSEDLREGKKEDKKEEKKKERKKDKAEKKSKEEERRRAITTSSGPIKSSAPKGYFLHMHYLFYVCLFVFLCAYVLFIILFLSQRFLYLRDPCLLLLLVSHHLLDLPVLVSTCSPFL
jgi:hypothetical protein